MLHEANTLILPIKNTQSLNEPLSLCSEIRPKRLKDLQIQAIFKNIMISADLRIQYRKFKHSYDHRSNVQYILLIIYCYKILPYTDFCDMYTI